MYDIDRFNLLWLNSFIGFDTYTPFKQAPFIFEYVNMLNEKRAKFITTVEKNLYKLLANSIYMTNSWRLD